MGCATADCGDPNCAVCRWARTPPTPRCQRWVNGHQCRLIEQHPGPCKPPYTSRKRQTEHPDFDTRLF